MKQVRQKAGNMWSWLRSTWEFSILFTLCMLLTPFFYVRVSNVAQWWRICLPVQETWVQFLIQADPTCLGGTKPMHHKYWACPLEPGSWNYWAHVLQLRKPVCLEPVLCNKKSHQDKKPVYHNQRVAPLTQTRQSSHAAMKTQHKNKYKFKKILC